MAQMYPKRVSEHVQNGEKLVYETLAKLPDDWVVFHNIWEHYIAPNDCYVNYEADFVVLVPEYGFVVIEVKDWTHARIHDGVWQSKSHHYGADWETMGGKRSPLHQADVACNRLKNSLVQARIFHPREPKQPERRCMAILTNCVPAEFAETPVENDRRVSERTNLPLDTLYVCGAAALQEGLEERIRKLFIWKKDYGRNMNAAMVEAMTSYLAPTVLFRMDLTNYVRLMDEAAAPLQELLPLLEESRGGIHVEGCAGSGKTMLAIREAARQAALLPRDGEHRILMLCYNHNLAHFLRSREELREQADVLTVSNFHEYCEHTLLEPKGKAELIRYDGKNDPLSDDALQFLNADIGAAPKYDAVFVDEAQDFRLAWWKLIERWLKPQGKFYIFADSRQKLYEHRGPLPSLPTRIRLRRNLRNVREIAEYSAAYLPDDRRGEALPLCGQPLMIFPGSESAEDRAQTVRAAILYIREHCNLTVRNRDIVVLSPWSANNVHGRSCFPYLGDILDYARGPEDAAEIEERHRRCLDPHSEKILGDTIKSFKGLESPFVILTDICGLEESAGFNLESFYVACTRAKFGLCIVPTTTGEELARQHQAIPPEE